jgi:hypothetical protein
MSLKSHPFGTFARIQGEYSFLPFKVCNIYRSTHTADMIVQGSDPMTTSSGASGFCQNENCGHANNEHKIKSCNGAGCSIRWKRCQIAGKCNGVHYRICKKCPYHEDGEPDW